MKIEFVTFFKEGERYRVIAKSAVAHPNTRWQSVTRAVVGDEIETGKTSRYQNPMTQYRNPQNSDELDAHMIRTGLPGQFAAAEPEDSKRRKKSFLEFTKDVDVIRAAKHSLGDLGLLRDLGAFPALEAHRRVMRLERHLCEALSLSPTLCIRDGQSGQAPADCSGDVEWLRDHRSKALMRDYFVFEYLSVYVPALCSHELKQDVKNMTERRVHAAVRDAWPLVEYGRRLSLVLGKLDTRAGEGWRAFGFEDSSWMPRSFQVGYEKVDLWNRPDPAIRIRNDKEADDLRQATQRRPDSDRRVPSLLAELRSAGPGLLAGDTWELDRTRDLPPTASAPDSSSDPVKFLALGNMES